MWKWTKIEKHRLLPQQHNLTEPFDEALLKANSYLISGRSAKREEFRKQTQQQRSELEVKDTLRSRSKVARPGRHCSANKPGTLDVALGLAPSQV